ncbi:flavodoxin family protein [Clostridium sp. MB40-C1]|uniref:flavodoxin family protein n=1 Tax=Clostridium sp. MB40-C1 TaxID=3070996 RepID=UPI0027DF8673|nr:flavodoxin family protein [Clostridium sp. MB40-C1]WMJ82179.1 flavodoxin family protein [Clostridium sp. MB40-C1]
MKAIVIFHSVCGNTYLMARNIYYNLRKNGADVEIFRVKDDDLVELSKKFPVVNDYLEEIVQVPIVSLDKVLESDYIFLGCPTYFGNVSAEMKAFMDSFSPLWKDASLFGKRLIAFTSCGNSEGSGDVCLKAINTFGQHLGMMSVPVPANLDNIKSSPAYGLIHYSGDMGDKRINEEEKKFIEEFIQLIINKSRVKAL